MAIFRRRKAPLTRRSFLEASALLPLCGPMLFANPADPQNQSHQATGTRVGDVTDSTAIVWCRLTKFPTRIHSNLRYEGRVAKPSYDQREVSQPVSELDGACPGAPGRVRLHYGLREDLSDAITTPWHEVTVRTDFTHHFALTQLRPGATYHYAVETAPSDGPPHSKHATGQFQTAFPPGEQRGLTFCVMTCQAYHDRDHQEGHHIYPSMQALRPQFACLTGDLVYYDTERPRAFTAELARYHWQRMFSLPRLLEFNRTVSTYWLKDDHDTLRNDSAPGESLGDFTFAEGIEIFRQQAPLADGPSYRTFRWGRDLQIWLTDGRDFRTPAELPDGPEKTIWGSVQKAWFQRTVAESNATWKILISPTPLVGPDRSTKSDNHANSGYRHEGDELRSWLKQHVPDNFFVICGDRHWQYHSVHPVTGLNEFSVGPASDAHAGGTPGEDKRYHRFHRVLGGFLSVTLQPRGQTTEILFRHHDVHGQVVYEFRPPHRPS